MLLTELIVPLKLDDTKFQKGIESAKTGASNLASSLVSIGGKAVVAGIAAVTATVTAVAFGMKKAIDTTIKWGDELDALQDVTNLTNDEAAGLNILLRKHGVEAATAAKSLTILNKNLVDANGYLASTGKALKTWGIKVKNTNGQLKTNAELTQEVADKYAELEPGAERVAFVTDVFGKSGAELNDVLLDLAENGLTKYIDKAKELGLNLNADDIQAYKQSLEDMQTAWESIQIFIGSKLLPIAKKFTEWLTKEAIPAISKFVQNAVGEFEKGGLSGLTTWLDEQLATALDNVDWEGLGGKFGDFLEGVLTNGVGQVDVPKSLEALGRGLSDFFAGALGADKMGGWDAYWQAWAEGNTQMDAKFRESQSKMDAYWEANPPTKSLEATLKRGLDNGKKQLDTWTNSLMTWGQKTGLTMVTAMNNLEQTITEKLRTIGKTFYDRAMHWTQQMSKGFNDNKGGLINAIGNLVQEINGVLKKIITAFTISVKLPSWLGGGSTGTGSVGTHNTGGTGNKGRASGGPVIAGQSYNVAEFYNPEVFTPNMSGRIDKMNSPEMQTVRVQNWNDFDYNRLASEVVKAQNNI
jgi:hypothetical protein